MKNTLLYVLFMLSFIGTTFAADSDGVVVYNENDRPVAIKYTEGNWIKLNEYEGKEFWLNKGDIEEHESFRHVFAMIRFTFQDMKVPGIGEGVRRIYSEGVVNCANAAVVPLRDYYTTDTSEVVGIHTHKRGGGVVIGRSPGTIANAMYSLACLKQLPVVPK